MYLCFMIININKKPDLWRRVLKMLARTELTKNVSVSRKLVYKYIAHESLSFDFSIQFA
jgi:hypothetical protein